MVNPAQDPVSPISFTVKQQSPELSLKVGEKKSGISFKVEEKIQSLPDDVNTLKALEKAIVEKCEELKVDPKTAVVQKVHGKLKKSDKRIVAKTWHPHNNPKKECYYFDIIWEVEIKVGDKTHILKRSDELYTNVKVPQNIDDPDAQTKSKYRAMLAVKSFRHIIKSALDPSHDHYDQTQKKIEELKASEYLHFSFEDKHQGTGFWDLGVYTFRPATYTSVQFPTKKTTSPKVHEHVVYRLGFGKKTKKKVETVLEDLYNIPLFTKRYKIDPKTGQITGKAEKDDKESQTIEQSQKYFREAESIIIDNVKMNTIEKMEKAAPDEIVKIYRDAFANKINISGKEYLQRVHKRFTDKKDTFDKIYSPIESYPLTQLVDQFKNKKAEYDNEKDPQKKLDIMKGNQDKKVIGLKKLAENINSFLDPIKNMRTSCDEMERFAGQIEELSPNDRKPLKSVEKRKQKLQKFDAIKALKSDVGEILKENRIKP